jgi:hypothetical protein
MAVRHQRHAIRSRGAGANLHERLLFVISPYGMFSMIFIVILFFSVTESHTSVLVLFATHGDRFMMPAVVVAAQ